MVRIHRAAHPRADVTTLHHAYRVAEELHRGQRRSSGDPYIVHPLAVAIILADHGMDTTTLTAALLHDTVEDTGYTLGEVEEHFGEEVAYLVDGVTKLEKLQFGASAEAETVRKILVATGRDLRVLVVKLADRLHNMRTLGFQPAHKQERTARATLDVLVPLADRLGMQLVRRELDDRALAILHPADHAEIVRLLDDRAAERERYTAEVTRRLSGRLRDSKLRFTVAARQRHLLSLHRARRQRGTLSGVHDAVRVVVTVGGGAPECYVALGAVHACYHPIGTEFKDYIATPKFNMYQALHTTVRGPDGRPLEVQVRTRTMHRIAEYGVCASYTGPRGDGTERDPASLEWLRRLLDWQRAVPGERFLTLLREDLDANEMLVFTAAGQPLRLPRGATPVDAAYSLSTDLGHRCIGARANGRLVPLSSILSDGDTIEILAADEPAPSEGWLDFAKSPKARIEIRDWFDQPNDTLTQRGRLAVSQALHAKGATIDVDDPALAMLDDADLDRLYTAVATGQVPAGAVAQWLLTITGAASHQAAHARDGLV